MNLFGWEVEGVDYAAPYRIDLPLGEEIGVIDLLAGSEDD